MPNINSSYNYIVYLKFGGWAFCKIFYKKYELFLNDKNVSTKSFKRPKKQFLWQVSWNK